MRYVKCKKLELGHYDTPMQMYPTMDEEDVVPAVYAENNGFKDHPDICALPPVLYEKDLLSMNVRMFPGYSHERIKDLPKSKRYEMLSEVKDYVRVYLPYQSILEQKIHDCLVSSYRNRRYGYLDSDKMIRSVNYPIDSNVQSGSLIGIAGTGKSGSIGLTLSRYPRAILHDLEGIKYTQIPCIACTAKSKYSIKSLFYGIAGAIDSICDTGGYYGSQVLKKGNVDLMEAYMVELLQLFHVGLIIIDEIQLVIEKNNTTGVTLFKHLLSMTQTAGVSVFVIGTEESLATLNDKIWFARRFTQLGRVTSDFPVDSEDIMESIISIIWQYQMTKKKYPLTKKIVNLLMDASACNIDYLTTLFVTAQLLVIGSEGTDKELALDYDTIKKAEQRYPTAKKLITDGKDLVDTLYTQEKNRLVEAISEAVKEQQLIEQKASMRTAADIMIDMQKKNAEICIRLEDKGFNDKKENETAIRKVESKTAGFRKMDTSQQAKLVEEHILKSRKKTKDTKKVEVVASDLSALQAALL